MRFTIGEFSRITSMSIKSLRLYHEKELLIPAEVDQWTGYRYYNEANYESAVIIRLLRDLDFSLAEIKDILLECREDMELQASLAKKLEQIQQRMQRDQAISRTIEQMLKQQKEVVMKSQDHFDIEEKVVETLLIAGVRMKAKYEEVGKGFSRLGQAMGRYISGKAMTLYYDAEYQEEHADYEACFPVRKGFNGKEGISVRELPGGKCIMLIHKGPYQTLGESYKRLTAYLHDKGYTEKLPSREIYLKGPGMIFKGNPNNYLTEIQIMIA